MAKRIISIFLTVIMLLTILPVSALAEDSITWTLSDDGVLTISGTGPMTDYAKGGAPWDSATNSIKRVIIADGVTAIGSYALYNCINLTAVTIPESVTTIGRAAFYNCANLTAVTIPESVTTIGGLAFCECASLTSVVIPDGVTDMGALAFFNCNSLTGVTIPDNITSVRNGVFGSCDNLTRVTIGNSVTVIEGLAFEDCANLTSVIIPDSVAVIDDFAFDGCSRLSSVTIGSGVTTIGEGAFNDCSRLTDVYYNGTREQWNAIEIESDNDKLIRTAIHFGSSSDDGWESPLIRLSGRGRCETAYLAADELKAALGVEKFDAIIIASGDNFADALAGSYLANVMNAPILLYRTGYADDNAAYIADNMVDNGTVYILGGTAAVPQTMENALAAYHDYTVIRVKGANRFETNLAILEEAGVGDKDILIATGYNFADSLSASATGLPILLVYNGSADLTESQKEFLGNLNGNDLVVIGGTGAVNDDLYNALSEYGDIERVKGSGREATSVEVAKKYFADPDAIVLAYSRNFPDGLCGGPLAYALGAPLLLTNAGFEAVAAGYVADNGIAAGYVMGGTAAVTDNTVYKIFNTVSDNESTYTVTFESNGGSRVVAQAIYAGECAFRPAAPTKEGYVFENWYADEELTTLFDFTRPINADTTVYANWIDLSVTIALDAGDYTPNIVNRVVTGSITHNIAIDSIAYELVSASGTTTGEIDLTEAEDFFIDVLLEDGDNVLTVSVATVDGSVASESVTMTFDSGYVYDSGEVYDDYDERLIKTAVSYSDDTDSEPDEYLVANILSLYFHDHVTVEEREAFITETLGGEVAGYLNSLDMMQVLLPNSIANAEEVGYTGETDLASITEEELWAYAEALTETYADVLDGVDPEHIYMNMELTITTNDTWDDGADDDWWLDAIDAYDAWEYDDYYNSDFLTDIYLGAVDSGFADHHVELRGNVGIISDEDTIDDHGTHVAGIMVGEANNGVGIAGVMYNNGYVYGYDVENSRGISDSAIKAGLTKAVEAGAKVINFSLGMSGNIASGSYNLGASRIKNEGKTWSKNMGKLIAKGYDFIVVQSAGNGNNDGVGVDYWHNGKFASVKNENCYSASDGWFSEAVTKQEIMDRIVIVAAVDSSNTMTGFSNGGRGELNIIAAPGAYMLSTVTGNSYTDSNNITHANRNAYHTYYGRTSLVTHDPTYAYMQGTSMAAPVVTAVCGMTWSVNKNLTGAEVVELVMNNTVGTAATNSSSHTTGGMGVVNALQAVEAAIESRTTYSFTVVDAVTGEGIPAMIKIHTDAPDGPLVGSEQIYYADSDGFFAFPKLPSNIYWLELSAEGYVSNLVYANCWGSRDAEQYMGTVALTPEMNEEEYRIILRWIGEPSDLDSHLVATTADGEDYHVYYSDPEPYPAYANLDRDDTDYEGPETVTITNFSSLRNIRYAVHDYTNRGETSSTVMSNSGAYVEVYKGSALVNTFYVPANTGGTEWDVFAIDANGSIIPMNQMKYCYSPGDVLGNAFSVYGNTVMSASDEKP